MLHTETPQMDELLNRHDAYWRGALAALDVQELDADTPDRLAEPVSFVLPYRSAMERYQVHVARCAHCSEGSFWDQCPEGDRLSQEAADAMGRMEGNAALN